MTENVHIGTVADFAIVMRDQRLRQNITQEDLAKLVGKSRKWVIAVEAEKINPTLGAVIKVARALGFSVMFRSRDLESVDLLALVLGES